MSKYIAFLRAINVGGTKIIKMEELRKIFEGAGLKNVQTYIQSGNVIFESDKKDIGKLTEIIESQLKKSLGYEVKTIVLPFGNLQVIARNNPFNTIKAIGDEKFYVIFIAARPDKIPDLPYKSEKDGVEIIHIEDKAVFIISRKVGDKYGSPNAYIEKEFKVAATSRNLNTLRNIVEKY